MGILINRLLVLLNASDSGSTYHHIALTLLQNLRLLQTSSIHDVAELCAVSKSTISKFIRELGYHDYADFRYAIEFEDKRYRMPGTFVQDVIGYLQEHSIQEYAQLLAEDQTSNVETLDVTSIDHLAQDIADAQNVAAFGLMFSETAAIDLQTKLGRVGKFIRTTQSDLQQVEYVRHADENTLLIVFSESGSFMDRYEMIDHSCGKSVFAETKAKVVMITANEKMAKDSRVDYIIKMRHTDAVHTHRIVYPLITDILTYRYYELLQK